MANCRKIKNGNAAFFDVSVIRVPKRRAVGDVLCLSKRGNGANEKTMLCSATKADGVNVKHFQPFA